MTYFPIPVESFGGLDLINDPGEVGFGGAVDLLDVDVDKRGRVRSRDGYSAFTTAAAARNSVLGYFPNSGIPQLIAWRGTRPRASIVSLGTTTASYVYATENVGAAGPKFAAINSSGTDIATQVATGGSDIYRWDGATWSTIAALNGYGCVALAVQAPDNRLVMAGPATHQHRVQFSNAGAPETVTANDYVELSPGDGDTITAACAWRDLLFVFKQNSFYVFFGNSTDSTGNSIFNYRAVKTGVGAFFGSCIATPGGVYFVDQTGVYRTTGGPPELVSAAIRPLFDGVGLSSFYGGSAINWAATTGAATWYPTLGWNRNRLYIGIATGASTATDKTLVFDPASGEWLLWSIPAGGFATGAMTSALPPQLFFSYASGANTIAALSTASTDNGTTITSRYQSGFESMSPPRRYIDRYGFGPSRKRVRSWRVMGTGAVTMAVAADFGAAVGATALTLGTSPAVAEARYSRAIRGSKISYKLSGTSPWAVNDLVGMLADTRESASDVSD